MSPRPRKPLVTPETRRRRARVAVALPVRVTLRGPDDTLPVGESVAGRMGNLSTGGAFVKCRRPFPAETPCLLSFVLHDNGASRQLTIPAWVAYTHRHGMGIQFDGLDGKTRALLSRQVNRILYNTP